MFIIIFVTSLQFDEFNIIQ